MGLRSHVWGWDGGGYRALVEDLKFRGEMSVLLGKRCVRLSQARPQPSRKQTVFCSEKKANEKLAGTRKKKR